MNAPETLFDARPSWCARKPDHELDCRLIGEDHSPVFKAVLETARALAPGKIMALVIDFEPLLLYQFLEGKGIRHWAEPAMNGWQRVYFSRHDVERRAR